MCTAICMTREERILNRYYRYLEDDPAISPEVYEFTLRFTRREGPPEWFRFIYRERRYWRCLDQTVVPCCRKIKNIFHRSSSFSSDSGETLSASNGSTGGEPALRTARSLPCFPGILESSSGSSTHCITSVKSTSTFYELTSSS
jgi:hypothetical protein